MKYESTRPDESNLWLLHCHKTAIDQEDEVVGKSCIEKLSILAIGFSPAAFCQQYSLHAARYIAYPPIFKSRADSNR